MVFFQSNRDRLSRANNISRKGAESVKGIQAAGAIVSPALARERRKRKSSHCMEEKLFHDVFPKIVAACLSIRHSEWRDGRMGRGWGGMGFGHGAGCGAEERQNMSRHFPEPGVGSRQISVVLRLFILVSQPAIHQSQKQKALPVSCRKETSANSAGIKPNSCFVLILTNRFIRKHLEHIPCFL